MLLRSLAVLCLALASLPSARVSLAAEPTAVEEPPKVQQIVAVERGGFVEVDFGAGFIVNKVDDRRYGLSVATSVFAGYDILPILAFSLGVTAWAAPVSDDESTPSPSGDLFFLIPMARLQVALLTTERHFVWVRGGAGFSFGLPDKLDDKSYGGNGPAFSATIGFERFTRLRHFSIGIEAGTLVVTKPSVGIGVFAQPTLKYTF
ncbi:MAG: adventurous gliding motility protein CglE [Deltaproteobacteria bacterium]|nr:adventurous gliding motility protein CglE [Deltaproteobacteria bacterium]